MGGAADPTRKVFEKGKNKNCYPGLIVKDRMNLLAPAVWGTWRAFFMILKQET